MRLANGVVVLSGGICRSACVPQSAERHTVSIRTTLTDTTRKGGTLGSVAATSPSLPDKTVLGVWCRSLHRQVKPPNVVASRC